MDAIPLKRKQETPLVRRDIVLCMWQEYDTCRIREIPTIGAKIHVERGDGGSEGKSNDFLHANKSRILLAKSKIKTGVFTPPIL